MTEEQNGTKKLLITREVGKRWEIDFSGKITQRDMNQLRRMLPVAFTRMKRTHRMKKAQELRNKQTEKETVDVKTMVQDRVEQMVTNVNKSVKEITDGSV